MHDLLAEGGSLMTHLESSADSPSGFRSDITVENRSRLTAPHSFFGTGSARGHHGELLQGVFTNDSGQLCRGLASLPCSRLFAEASVELSEVSPLLTVEPGWKSKALRAAETAMKTVGARGLGGTLKVSSNIAVGCGFGSSTADVTASIRAVLDALDVSLTTAEIAKLAVAVEVAADPLMFDELLLFAQREGEVIERFRTMGRSITALGIYFPMEPIDTIEFSVAHYNNREIETFAQLRTMLRESADRSDILGIAHVATESARINQRFLPVPSFDSFLQCIRDDCADGIQVAHSGNVGAFLFDSEDPNLMNRVQRTKQRLYHLGIDESWLYQERL
jgi:uncharacterized protein involved in propanediol utilization